MRKGFLQKRIVIFGQIVDKVIFTHVVVIGLPTLLYYWILDNKLDVFPIQVLIPILYLITSIVVIGESTVAALWQTSHWIRERGILQKFFRRFSKSSRSRSTKDLGSCGSPPRSSIVVVAYLPNEQYIILDTLKHILNHVKRPEGGLELILAYNTPVRLPIENELQRLSLFYPELRVLSVEGSHSKAENLNAALQIITGEVTCILDADHWPAPDCLYRAWSWLSNDRYDVVQGRNVIRNHDSNFLTRLVAVEFECLYGVSHPAKSILVDTAIFGGSNGYWRTSVLRRVRFRSRMMTEDIDTTLRTLLSGHRIVHDPSIIATELAPIDLQSFWSQRKRWAQGWLEVALKYQWSLWHSSKLDSWQKGYWTILLLYSLLFHFVALQIFPMLLSFALCSDTTTASSSSYVYFTTILTLLSGPYQTLVALKLRNKIVQQPVIDFLIYCLMVPFFCVLKSVIAITAIYDHLLGNTEWVVTRRGYYKQQPQPEIMLTYAKQVNR